MNLNHKLAIQILISEYPSLSNHPNVSPAGDSRACLLFSITGNDRHDNDDSCQGVDRVPSYAVLAETA